MTTIKDEAERSAKKFQPNDGMQLSTPVYIQGVYECGYQACAHGQSVQALVAAMRTIAKSWARDHECGSQLHARKALEAWEKAIK